MADGDFDRPENVTLLLRNWQSGDQSALAQLTPLVYAELRKLATSHMRKEREGHTLQPTALVHEAYMRMVDQDVPAFKNRSHFFAVAAQLMRQIVVDFARKHRSQKQGSGKRTSLEGREFVAAVDPLARFLDLNHALERLAEFDERKSRVIEMKYFAGLQREEIAEAIGLSVASVKRDLLLGEAWLRRELGTGGKASGTSA